MKPRENIETIYQTALEVFAQFGFSKTTMEDIAGRLSMTKGNLYLYATNKRDLYHKTAEFALLKWQARVAEAVVNESDVKQKFLTMCFKAAEHLAEDRHLRSLLIRDPEIFPMFPTKDPFEEINRNSIELIKSILRVGMAEGAFRRFDIERMSEVIFMIYKMFIIRMYTKTENRVFHEMLRDTVDLCTQGLFADDINSKKIKSTMAPDNKNNNDAGQGTDPMDDLRPNVVD
jgi:AcrR family transcriptional regulator